MQKLRQKPRLPLVQATLDNGEQYGKHKFSQRDGLKLGRLQRHRLLRPVPFLCRGLQLSDGERGILWEENERRGHAEPSVASDATCKPRGYHTPKPRRTDHWRGEQQHGLSQWRGGGSDGNYGRSLSTPHAGTARNGPTAEATSSMGSSQRREAVL